MFQRKSQVINSLFILVLALCIPIAARSQSTMQTTDDDFSRGAFHSAELRKNGAEGIGLAHKKKDAATFVSSGCYTSPVFGDGSETQWRTIQWTEQWTTPQHFKRFAGNPVLDPKRTGAWDNWTNGVCIVRFGNTYRMFFASAGNGQNPPAPDKVGGIGWADASVDDPTSWHVNPNNPVLKLGPVTSFESYTINQPRVIQLSGTHWRMYYTGWDKAGNWKLGMAESYDQGATWEKYAKNPILPAGPGAYDSMAACVPHVIQDGDIFKMWYTARGPAGISLAYATSTDGINWKKYEHNPVLSPIPGSPIEDKVISRCNVRKEGGVYKLWYSMRGTSYRIGYAESLDGIHWERSPLNPIMDKSAGKGFDNEQIEYPEIQRQGDGTYRMWFCGNTFGSVGYAESLASPWSVIVRTRSGNSPQPDKSWSEWSAPCRHSQGSPILSPTGKYLQYRADFQTANRAPDNRVSPALARVEITHEPDPSVAIKVPKYSFRGTHYEIGRQFGQAERERIGGFFKMYSGTAKVAALAKNPQPLRNIKEFSPKLYEEMRGIGDGAGLSVEQIAALVYCDEPLCSGIAFAKTKVGPVVAKTTDGSIGQGINYAAVLREPTDGGYATISMGHTGTITAETVMNDQGLCLGVSGLQGKARHLPRYVSWMTLTRMAAEQCRTVQEAVDFMAGYDVYEFGFCLIMGDASGDIAVLEKTSGGHQALRRPEAGAKYIYEFNVALTPEMKPIAYESGNGVARMNFARDWFSKNPLPRSLEDVKAMYAQRGDPTGFCQAGDGGMHSLVTIIMLPQQGCVHVGEGYPDKMKYEGLRFK